MTYPRLVRRFLDGWNRLDTGAKAGIAFLAWLVAISVFVSLR